MRLVSWIVAARQCFFFHWCSVCMAMSMSVLFAVFSLELIPRMIPIGRWEVPFFFVDLVFGGGYMCIHLGGIVVIKDKLPLLICSCVSSSR
jgi:hypothetical protein